jgi:membrane peptidoglycan carboxypeptidase
VKNVLVGDARSGLGGVVRKAKELVISTKMSREWSGDAVLQSYLNIIYFAAARTASPPRRRRTSTNRSNSSRCRRRLLAALIQRPSTLDPAVDPGARPSGELALTAWSPWARSPSDRAAQVFPPTVPPNRPAHNQTTGPNGLIERQVTKELSTCSTSTSRR